MTATAAPYRAHHQITMTAWRPLSVCIAVMLTLFLVTIHAQHMFDESASNAGLHAAHVVAAAAAHVPSVGIDMVADGMHCELPSILLPQVAAIDIGAPLVIWLAPLLLVAVAWQRCAGTGRPPPRPPGPTRQAILHCFRL